MLSTLYTFGFTGLDAHKANIFAATTVAETVKTSFGPKGMDKVFRLFQCDSRYFKGEWVGGGLEMAVGWGSG